jgi:hypothetical protein
MSSDDVFRVRSVLGMLLALLGSYVSRWISEDGQYGIQGMSSDDAEVSVLGVSCIAGQLHGNR